jgi:hypothetical protein
VPAAAAFVKHSAHDGGHYDFIYLIVVYYLVPAAAACVRHPVAA